MVGPVAALSVVVTPPSVALAEPFVGVGEAKGSEWKQPPAAHVVRTRALRRARTAAIKAALGEIAGVDAAARKSVLSSHTAWTSAYRIVSEKRTGDAVRLEIAVEVDVARLTKRVGAKGKAGGRRGVRPRFALGSVNLTDGASEGTGCGDPETLPALIADELVALGAVATADDETMPVDLKLACVPLGAVRYTHMRAARVSVVATMDGRTVATAMREGFADEDAAAVQTGLSAALFAVGARLAAHQQGAMTVRIESPGPGDQVRRLERAIRDGVVGVDAVRVSGLDRGAVVLTLETELAASTMAKRLSALRLPELSVVILSTEEPDAVTIRLR